ncbi:MAG TPA: hypothetical protein VLL54_15040 [Pyrinomonadaceae bacterium]|nr:hypothetical protein [Pyrinomonadaceae bacterium]
MRKFAGIRSLIFVAVCMTAPTISAQQITIAELRDQIRKFELVARDSKAPSQVQSINESVLRNRRLQLRTLLRYQLESLRKYQAGYQTHFSAKEKQTVVSGINALEVEIQSLDHPSLTAASSSRTEAPTTFARSTAPMNVSAAVVPQSQVVVVRSTPVTFTLANAPVTYATLDFPNAVIFNSTDAGRIIKEAIAKGVLNVAPEYYDGASKTFSDDFYCVIHVMRWADPSAANAADGSAKLTQTVASQNWYVFNNGKGKGFGNSKTWSNEDFTSLNRIFGVKRIHQLYIHLNSIKSLRYAQARYDFNIEKKAPQNLSNLFNVAQLFITFPSAAVAGAVDNTPENLWGGDSVDLLYVPSNVTITASIVKDVVAGPMVALDKPKKFDNEGRYWWDVSVALPVKHISQTQFDTTANTVTAKKVDKQNAFALINLYPVPVDIKGSTFTWVPHFVGGVAIQKQPLKKFLLGAGFGPRFANFYVGAVFTEEKKPSTLKEGDSATQSQLDADLRKHYKPKFSFGFNLPVRGILESLKADSK